MTEKNSLNPNALLEGLYNILKNNGEKPIVAKNQQKVSTTKNASTPVGKDAKSTKPINNSKKPRVKAQPKVKEDYMDEDDVVADEELSMFSRHNVGKRGGRGQGNNPWNKLKKRGRKFKTRTRNEDAEIEECAGVGIVDKQNSTADVGSDTLQKNLTAFNLEEALNDMRQTLVRESALRQGTKNSVPNIETWDALDNNNNPYLAYRYGIALASAPTGSMDKTGPIGGDFVTIGYTSADQQIIDKAAKTIGVKSKPHGDNKSKELGDVNTKSAIGQANRNQYGV
jgi:hypothetical protein